MSRIIAGQAGGRRLVVPRGRATRPTSDRAREGLFSTLAALRGPLDGARVLDLYAGSGALGLEALSRGAAVAVLVECDPKVALALRANVSALGLPGAVVVADRVERLLAREPDGPAYDVLVADPPYAMAGTDLRNVLAALPGSGWLALDGVAVVERASRDPDFGWPAGWSGLRARRYGEATLWYGRPG